MSTDPMNNPFVSPAVRKVLGDLPASAAVLIERETRMVLEAESPAPSEFDAASHRVWALVRDLVHDAATGATVEHALATAGLRSGTRAATFRITDVIRAIRAAGELECSLLAERDRVNAALAELRGEAVPSVH